MYTIEYTEAALEDIAYFRIAERRLILDEIDRHLTEEPTTETRNRKRLRPNKVAEWELRIGKYRVFYDVIETAYGEKVNVVKIEAVGVKQHQRLRIRGKEFDI